MIGGSDWPGPSESAPLELISVVAGPAPQLLPRSPQHGADGQAAIAPQVLCLGAGGGSLRADLSPVERQLSRDLTLELWIRTETEDDQRILSDSSGLELLLIGEHLRARIAGHELRGSRVRSGVWHHVALVVLGGEARLYLNGEHQERVLLPERWQRPGGALVLGQRGSDGLRFEGQLDDLRLAARALYQQTLFDPPATLQPVDQTLIGMRLDQELPGGLVQDNLGQVNQARLAGDAGLCAVPR